MILLMYSILQGQLDQPKKETDSGKLGVYDISYICPRDILVPILPKKKILHEKTIGIEWDLFPGEGVFASVDIDNAISAGYTIEFKRKCLVYDDKSPKVFSEYVTKFYKLKEIAEREDNKVKRSIAKLMLNSLYGKTLQKAIFNTTTIINDIFEFNKFVLDYDLTDYSILNDNKMIVSGTTKNKIEKIKKPCQLGAFVTAYSRKFMLFYMLQVDPTLRTLIFTYTDTDSLHLTAYGYRILLEKGYIVPKDNAKLGYMCSDIDDEGVIIHEKNLAPKTYCYQYLTNKNKLAIDDLVTMKDRLVEQNHISSDMKQKEVKTMIEKMDPRIKKELLGDMNMCTMKAKGIPDICLEQDFYADSEGHVVEFDGLKKIHKKITTKQKDDGISNF